MPAQPIMNMRGLSYALAATVLWSGNFIVARMLTQDVPPITVSFLRWLAACLFLVPLCGPAFVRSWPLIRQHWKFFFLASITGSSLFSCLIYLAAVTSSALNMSLIATSSPVFTLVLARIFLKEALFPLKVLGILLALCGVILLITRGDLQVLLHLRIQTGDLFCLCSAACFALYTIQLRSQPISMPPMLFIATISFMALLTLVPFTIVELWRYEAPLRFTWPMAASFIYMGLGASVAAFLCWIRAVGEVGAGNAMLLYYTLPFFSGMEAVIFLNESVHWVHWASGALILGGILVATRVRGAN